MYARLFGLATLTVVVSVKLAAAQQPTWAQCGGIGWAGGTSCVAGTTCTKLNDYYSQCIPGASAPTTTVSTPTGPTSVPGPGPAAANFWFSFGDSYTTTGFNPSGQVPAPGNVLGNPPYPGSTMTGGPNWIDFMTTVNNKSLVLTYNYAYSGATIDPALVPPFSPAIRTIVDQVNQFMDGPAKKPASAPWTSENALFSIWIGINDIGTTYSQGGDRDAFSDRLMDAYFAQVQKLVNVGARNFLFINVPPVDRSPLMIGQGANAQAAEKKVIAGYNAKLVTRADAFKTANTGVKTWFWDSASDFTRILDNPTQFGFSDATSVGNAKSFWGDVYHPASAAHKILAQNVAEVISDTIW
ncbi:hypothetical protein C8Q76DRAFT_780872 [Earliella scabrosa]|nr:hypothetical protein C8Q76DRAFT_780872 [Earliella scabrosa]